MDVGNKSLSQLSQEAKEKRYVALDVGAKVSGYTKEYLERLCRLNKVEYRMWNNGQFVIELESLLRETHTILLSYEDIVFVEKTELSESTAQIVGAVLSSMGQSTTPATNAFEANKQASQMFSQKVTAGITQAVPSFGNANRSPAHANGSSAFSFIGHAVVSDPLHPDAPAEIEKTPITVTPDTQDAAVRISPRVLDIPVKASAAPQKVTHVPTHISISADEGTVSKGGPVHLSVTRENELPEQSAISTKNSTDIKQQKSDEWDALLLEKKVLPAVTSEAAPVSAIPAVAHLVVTPDLHPIQTSLDVSVHHDDAPLFSFTEKVTSAHATAETRVTPFEFTHPGIPDLGSSKRVVVFSSQETAIPQKPATLTATPPTAALSAHPEEPAHPSVALLFAPPPTPPPALSPLPAVQSTSERKLERVIPTLPQKPQSLLPVKESEHHLIVRENFPLAKSVPFNMAFAAVLCLSLLSFSLEFPASFLSKPITYVAAVVSAAPENSTLLDLEKSSTKSEVAAPTKSEMDTLPFSDDIRIATGTAANSITVAPVFGDVEGDSVEYTIQLTRKVE